MSGTTLVSLGPLPISPTGVSPSALCFSKTVRLSVKVPRRDPQPRSASTPVWPLPRSLAATWRIDVSFSSWGYLDVSVHPVSFCTLWIHVQMRTHCSARVPPFGNLRVIGYLLLTAAYRSLSRPSSAPSAKASALCSFSLDLRLVFFPICFVSLPRSFGRVPLYTPSFPRPLPCSSC